MSLWQGCQHNARRAVVAAGVVLLASVMAPDAGAQALRRVVAKPMLKSLKFDGNVALTDTELRAAIITQSSGCKLWEFCRAVGSKFWYRRTTLDRAELDRDLLRIRVLYWKHGWRAAQVTPVVQQIDNNTVAVTLRVVEGPPTVIGALELGALDRLLDEHGLRSLVTARVGEPLNLIKLDSIAARIAGHLDAEGFGDITVTPVAVADTSSPRARVSMEFAHLYQTRVESVRVEGTEKYDPRLVANTMAIKAGETYSRARVVESQRALYEAGYFKRAFVRVDPGSTDSLKKLVATVEELATKSFRVTGGVSTAEFVQFDARYLDANFRNNAGRLTLQATVGNLLGPQLNDKLLFTNVLPTPRPLNAPEFLQPTFQLNADVRRRWLRDSRNQTGISLFGYRRSSPGVFVDQGGGAAASFTRNVTRAIPISAQYRLEFTDVNAADAYYCVNFGVCDESSLRVLQSTQRLAPLALTASSDQRDDPIGPTRGFTWRAELELADTWTGSQLRYGRVEAEASKYFHASDKLTIAVRGHAGHVRGRRNPGDAPGSGVVVHPRKRFYAGGARSVRGYGENQLGPRVLVIPRSVFQPDEARFNSLLTVDSLRSLPLPCAPSVALPDCPVTPYITLQQSARLLSDFNEGDFSPKPLGAETLVEASIEARYRVWGPITVAAFIDAGSVGANFGGRATVFTPGIGVRYLSPVGPIRVDIGYNPRGDEQLTVITELEQPRDAGWLRQVGISQGLQGTALDAFSARTGLYQLNAKRSFNPATGTGLGGAANRLTLHLSIGEAF